MVRNGREMKIQFEDSSKTMVENDVGGDKKLIIGMTNTS